ncbi:MAG: sugar phosphate isomerase/epimerase [Fimbriimonadia bacterium]
MRIGFIMGFDEGRLKFAKENGFRSAEFAPQTDAPYRPGKPGWERKAKDVRAAFDAAGLRISCIAGFYVNHLDGPDVRAHKKLVRDVILLAEAMKVPVVGGFGGKKLNAPLEDSIPLFKKVWTEHAKFAEDHGVKIAFENCPMGPYHQPPGGNNCMCTPWMWEACFDAVGSNALGLEWDPSHLICMFIDPVQTLRKFGSRVYHVHAKDAKVNRDLLAANGVWSAGAIEHCFPGLGDTDWAECIKELRRQGYHGDLNIEGWHDAVYRDHPRGRKMEDEGLIIGLRHLEQFVVQD